MKQIDLDEAKTRLSRLVDRASRGESFVIAKSGTPMARLVPLGPERNPKIRYGSMTGKIWLADDFDAPLQDEVLDSFEGNIPE